MSADDSRTASAPEAGGRWAFDETVTAAFDDMLSRSIPNYADMRQITTDAAKWLYEATGRDGLVVDLGASRGEALAPLAEDATLGGATFMALETSPPMVEALRARFGGRHQNHVRVVSADLRNGLAPLLAPLERVNVVLSVLTMQFIPIEYRQRLLLDIHRKLAHGGGLVLVEKVMGEGAEADELLIDAYYRVKRGNGYSEEAIQRKRLSLEGVLVPVTARMNEEFLRAAGFTVVEVIWAYANFRAWVAIKR